MFKEAIRGEERDYTEGSIRKAIFLLSIPLILELSLESLFAIVDIFFVGRLGENAIAVVGYTEAMITIIYSIAIGLSTAATAVISRRIGEKSPGEAAVAAGQAIFDRIHHYDIYQPSGYVFCETAAGFHGGQ
ncbi:MAG: hypothetical protein IPN29_06010 [Saprospiraceae bacterium]|nr:hypothetical protein [Saprospiraceae bacterium]